MIEVNMNSETKDTVSFYELAAQKDGIYKSVTNEGIFRMAVIDSIVLYVTAGGVAKPKENLWSLHKFVPVNEKITITIDTTKS